MGDIIVHFDREWEGNVMRMDYKWEKEEKEYLIEDIPCKKFPLGNEDYLEDYVALALDMIIHLQMNGDMEETVSFIEIEKIDGFLDELKSHLDSQKSE
ncbi:hypothetical protein [Bacillus thuringiensis]|uniref:Uncharacterized protein n=1 Tax=Bacillus thuringiensis TaxID=1428 RepID=A0A9X6ZPM9_BACTU|nr:hypothetical protein [Bacillus thuringiensis]PFJ25168.1 hypothetical protein COJ15_35910 [Bacillus thuringiensis]